MWQFLAPVSLLWDSQTLPGAPLAATGVGVSGCQQWRLCKERVPRETPGAAGSRPSSIVRSPNVLLSPCFSRLCWLKVQNSAFIETHIWFSNLSTLASCSPTERLKAAAGTRSHADWQLDGLLGFEIFKGRFGCRPLWPPWKLGEPEEGR